MGGSAALGLAAAAAVAWLLLRARRRGFDPLRRRRMLTVKYDLAPAVAHGALPMHIADMDLPCCASIHRAICARAAHPTFGYTIQPTVGWARVARWHTEVHGCRVAPEMFCFSASVITSVCNLIDLLTEPGDGVLVMTPLFAPLTRAIIGCGRKLVAHPLHAGADGVYEMDVDRLERALPAARALLLCSPHNPGGRVWSAVELRDLARACATHGVSVIADEIWADWALWGSAHVPFHRVAEGVARDAPLAYACLGAPTKTWNLAGLHCTYVLLPQPTLRDRYLAHVAHAFLHYGSAFATCALLGAYGREGARWLAATKALVEANYALLVEALRAGVAEIVPMRPQATYLVWLDCTALAAALRLGSPAELNDFVLGEARLVLAPGDEFGDARCGFHQRINIACERRVVAEAAERLVGAVARRRAELRAAATGRDG